MKQRLGIARAILCRPELLVLDDPTNGPDPAGMEQLRDLFKMLCVEYRPMYAVFISEISCMEISRIILLCAIMPIVSATLSTSESI